MKRVLRISFGWLLIVTGVAASATMFYASFGLEDGLGYGLINGESPRPSSDLILTVLLSLMSLALGAFPILIGYCFLED